MECQEFIGECSMVIYQSFELSVDQTGWRFCWTIKGFGSKKYTDSDLSFLVFQQKHAEIISVQHVFVLLFPDAMLNFRQVSSPMPANATRFFTIIHDIAYNEIV